VEKVTSHVVLDDGKIVCVYAGHEVRFREEYFMRVAVVEPSHCQTVATTDYPVEKA
jgi:hypothetical protein